MIPLPRLRCVVLMLAWLSAMAGCGEKFPTFEEMQEANRKELALIVDKHRAAATARIDAIKAVGKEAKDVPPVRTREPAAVPVPVASEFGDSVKAGLLLIPREWAAGEWTATLPARVESDLPLGSLNAMLAGGGPPVSGFFPQAIDANFAILIALKQAALVRIHQYDQPKATVASGERRFIGGKAVGDVLIYDLDTRKRIAAFPFEIAQVDEASIQGRDEAAIQKELEQSFASNFAVALRIELFAFAAGKDGPATPGAAAKASIKRFTNKISLELSTRHFAAFVKSVDLTTADDGTLIVTIHADSPRVIADKDGIVKPEVKALVEKILGHAAVVKVVKAEAGPEPVKP